MYINKEDNKVGQFIEMPPKIDNYLHQPNAL